MKKQLEAKPVEAADDEAERLEILLDEIEGPGREAVVPERIDGIVVGSIAGIEGENVLVRLVPGSAPMLARSMISLVAEHAGRPVALMFERGDPSRPIVMGLIETLGTRPLPADPAATPVTEERPAGAPDEASRDEETEERIVLSAEKDIVLQCGKASITLTRAGKILIKGAYVLTRSTGVNRILGGTVQIN